MVNTAHRYGIGHGRVLRGVLFAVGDPPVAEPVRLPLMRFSKESGRTKRQKTPVFDHRFYQVPAELVDQMPVI